MQYYIGKTSYISLFKVSQMCDFPILFHLFDMQLPNSLKNMALPCPPAGFLDDIPDGN